MSVSSPAPIYAPLFDDPTGQLNAVAAQPWILFFNQLASGDVGQSWNPIISNLTTVGGTPQIVGALYQLSSAIALFFINIIPAAGGSTSAVAGTTFVNNFPLVMQSNGVCWAVSGLLGTMAGMCDLNSNDIYPPAWTAVTVPLTIIGIVGAS